MSNKTIIDDYIRKYGQFVIFITGDYKDIDAIAKSFAKKINISHITIRELKTVRISNEGIVISGKSLIESEISIIRDIHIHLSTYNNDESTAKQSIYDTYINNLKKMNVSKYIDREIFSDNELHIIMLMSIVDKIERKLSYAPGTRTYPEDVINNYILDAKKKYYAKN
jgi:hypothetical protein